MSQFLDAVAHDLRTPLTAIRGAAELMLDERLPETARAEMASMLVRQLVYADDLLGQLQAASRIEAGVAQPELEDCPLITALRQAIDLVGLGDHAELSVDVSAVADAADAAPALAPDAGVRARVLVADDSAELRAVVARQLARGGYAVVEARDGSEALDLARSGAIEIALVDLDMPGLDGFGLLRQLRAEPGTASLPLILISGRAMPSDAAR